MSDPRSQPVPRRHVVPGLLLFATFIGLSLAGQARLEARQPQAAAFDASHDSAAFDVDSDELVPGTSDPKASPGDEPLEVVAEAGELGTPVAPEAATAMQEALAPVEPPPTEAPLTEPPSSSPAADVLAGLEEALAGLEGAGRDPGSVMVAVQRARAQLQQVERGLKELRGTEAPGLDEAGRAHGRLMRASFEFDSAARQALRPAPSAMGDPFSAPERLVEEARARVAAARQAMNPVP